MAEDQENLKLQSNDNPGLSLVSTLLDGSNFFSWSRSIKIALGAKMKLNFINGEGVKPAEGSKEIEQWIRTDYMVTSWILNSISKDIVESFLYTNTSRELWLELESRFGQTNGPMIYQLKRDLSSTLQGSMSVSTYFSKLKRLWDELACITPIAQCTCGAAKESADIKVADQLIQFLMGLNENYDHVRNQILMMDPLPNVSRAYSMVLRVEKQREVTLGQSHNSQQMAMPVFKRNENQRFLGKKRNLVDKRTQVCKECGKTGHLKEVCFEIYGYPEWYKSLMEQRKKGGFTANRTAAVIDPAQSCNNPPDGKAISEILRTELHKFLGDLKPQSSTLMREGNLEFSGKCFELLNSETSLYDSWIIDSGATAHMCNNNALFDKINTNIPNSYIHLADNSKCKIVNSGDLNLGGRIQLKDVLYVPGLKFNLLSVSKICNNTSIRFEFIQSHCIVQDHMTNEVLAIGCQIGKLYIIKDQHFDQKHIKNIMESCRELGLSALSIPSEIWHRRLGHASQNVMIHTRLVKESKVQENICETCPLAKQQRLSFPLSVSTSDFCFDLMHIDLWGPYNEYSISRCNYMMTIVDDHSRCTWVFLMKQKSETTSLLIDFHKMILTQFDKRIKIVRTDNGSEFLGQQIVDFYKREGIIHQTTCTYTPQQNGVVERKHKHLLEVARSLMFQSKLPKMFWTDAILTATYIINRLPTPILKWKTPYEILYNKPVDYSHFKTFGCLCFATNNLPNKTKFEPRAMKCVFLGYAMNQKGYKVYDLDKRITLVSRDVRFQENVFPYQEEQIDPVSCSLPQIMNELEPAQPDEYEQNTEMQEFNTDTQNIDVVHEENNENNQNMENLTLRRSSRVITKPTRYNDFICNNTENESDISSVSFLPHMHDCLFTAHMSHHEPKSYIQAVKDKMWIDAMENEIKALEDNHTWDITKLPPNKKAIGCKWIFKIKLNPDGTIDRYKARLVAKGYNQIEGIDYLDSFSPVAKIVTVRAIIAISAKLNWHLHQVDINNAFLHGYLDEEIYMQPPEGYEVPKGHVCRLKRSLYGLKQASRQWNQEFTSKLESYGFVQSKHDYCLFTKDSLTGFYCLLVYVDDVLIAGPSEKTIAEISQYPIMRFLLRSKARFQLFLSSFFCKF
ncbi:UNVERIFIED_CONTAM: Retrovirus-related Pol polyprotein from transposon TNT 1-94 [Sesamum indicum]